MTQGINEIYDLRQRVAKLERTVAFLLERLKLEYVDKPDHVEYADIVELVRQNKKIEAVRLYRDKTGASLMAAKEFVDKL